jgi:hypothetical protein
MWYDGRGTVEGVPVHLVKRGVNDGFNCLLFGNTSVHLQYWQEPERPYIGDTKEKVTFIDRKLYQAREHCGFYHEGERLPAALKLQRIPGLKAFHEQCVQEGDDSDTDDDETNQSRNDRRMGNQRQPAVPQGYQG